MSTDLDGGGEGGGSGYNMAEPKPVQTFYPASPSGWHYQPHPSSRAYRPPASPNSQHQPELRSCGATPPSPALTRSSSVLSPLVQGPSFGQLHLPPGLASQNIPSNPNPNSLGQHQQNSSQPYLFSFPALDSHAGPTRRLTMGSQDREESLAHEGGSSFAPPGKVRMARSFSTGDSRYISEMREMTEAEIKEEKRKRNAESSARHREKTRQKLIYLEGRVEDLERQLLDQSSTGSAPGSNGGGGDTYKDQLIAQLQRENYEMRMREVQHASDFSRASLPYSPTSSRHPVYSHSQSQSIASQPAYNTGFSHNSASQASHPDSPSSMSTVSPITGPPSNGSMTSPYQDNSPTVVNQSSTSQASGMPSSVFTFPPTTLSPPRSLAQIYANQHHSNLQLHKYATLPMHTQYAHQQQPHHDQPPETASASLHYQPTQSQSQSQRYQAAMHVYEQQQQNRTQQSPDNRPRLSHVDTVMARSRSENVVQDVISDVTGAKFARLSESGQNSPLVVD